jgi:hypothetical protein
MPRPKSEITGKQISVAVRVTASQKAAFKQLGGAAWLRKQLADELQKNWQEKQTGLGARIINRVFGR